ncbi:hypothetical protein L873DRAFT_1783206 [Choiromyces venosus 120613-1]|uniref:Uncharacterized protein n=1 Tax=Choiromyces venosus 120613-1 TaxID=1336337 RepID=A0A3N4IVA3_9PEZI|nr:hypothetical protein L873DRAFT_1783206 [Choiromyces venosus 120613-1]
MPHKQATTGKVTTRNQKLVSPAENQDECATCDAILVTRSQISQIGSDEEMKKDAKDALEQALQVEELHVGEVRGEPFVGNRRGLGLAGLPARIDAQDKKIALLNDETISRRTKIALLNDEATSRRTKIALLNDEATSHGTKIALLNDEATSHRTKIASLEDRVGSLTSSHEAYKLLRNRFISTFKRDKGLVKATEADRRIIAEGNGWVHGGDVVVDAQLYEGVGGRKDIAAFKKLYAVSPADVQTIRYQPTIDALNTHAGIIASKHKIGTDEFYARFSGFIRLLEEFGYDDGYLGGNATDVTRAYWSFLNCIKDEVKRVNAIEASD